MTQIDYEVIEAKCLLSVSMWLRMRRNQLFMRYCSPNKTVIGHLSIRMSAHLKCVYRSLSKMFLWQFRVLHNYDQSVGLSVHISFISPFYVVSSHFKLFYILTFCILVLTTACDLEVLALFRYGRATS